MHASRRQGAVWLLVVGTVVAGLSSPAPAGAQVLPCYESLVTDYLGYFQLGDASDLEPYGTTNVADWTVAASGSVEPGLIATCNSSGALSGALSFNYGDYATSLNPSPVAQEFWFSVPDKLRWHTEALLAPSPRTLGRMATGNDWVLYIETTPVEGAAATINDPEAGHSGHLLLFANNLNSEPGNPLADCIRVPIDDFRKPHLVTIVEQKNPAWAASNQLVTLYVDGVFRGTTVVAFSGGVRTKMVSLSGISGDLSLTPSLKTSLTYDGASIIFDEAVLYHRLVTPDEVLTRYLRGLILL